MTMSRRTLLATALVLTPMAAMAQTTPPLTAEQMKYYGTPFQDARFVGFARTANDFEVQSGNLALSKSTNALTRGAAIRAVQVFTDASTDLERNRNEAGVTGVPDEDFKKISDDAMTHLNSLSGPDFDHAYGTYQLRLLTAIVAQYGAYSQDMNNSGPLRRYAQTEFPKMAQALESVTHLTAGK
jgi:putative membrane protein